MKKNILFLLFTAILTIVPISYTMEEQVNNAEKSLFKFVTSLGLADEEHESDISTPIFLGNNRFIAYVESDVIKICDIETKQCIQTLNNCGFATKIIQSQDGKQLIAFSLFNNIRILDLESGVCLKSLSSISSDNSLLDKISSISSDGSLYCIVKRSDNKNSKHIEIYDISTNILQYRIRNNIHDLNITFSHDNSKFIAESSHCKYAIYDIATNSFTDILGMGFGSKFAFNPINSTQIALINICHEAEYKLDLVENKSNSGNEEEKSMDDIIEIWDSITEKYIKCFKFDDIDLDSDGLANLRFSSDGKYLVVHSHHGIIKIWNFESDICLQTIFTNIEFGTLFFSPDGTKFALAGIDKKTNFYTLNIYTLKSAESDNAPVDRGA